MLSCVEHEKSFITLRPGLFSPKFKDSVPKVLKDRKILVMRDLFLLLTVRDLAFSSH